MAETLRRGEGSLRGVKGVRLAYRTWERPNARAALMVVHGLGEHSGRYAEFGERMATYGISTFVMDLRGHGLSDGRRGHVPRFDIHLQEVDRFRREVEGLADLRVPLFLFGQSMGGLIALRYLEEYEGRFRGAIIASPWLATAMPVPRWKVAVAGLLNRVLPALPLRHGIDPAHLSHDPEVVDRYRGDPLVHGHITPRTFSEASAAMGLVLQRSDRISEPLLFLLGGDDMIVDTGRSLHFARAIAGRDVTVKVCAGQYHEVHNEIDRPAIHREIREWIMARV